MKTPSEELANMILAKLVTESCVTKEDAEKLFIKMAAGKLRTEDWKLAMEKSTHKRMIP